MSDETAFLFLMSCPTCDAPRMFNCHLVWRDATRPKPASLTPFNSLDVLSMHNKCVCMVCGCLRPTIDVRVYETLIQLFADGETDVLL